jgi:uncharacterized protein
LIEIEMSHLNVVKDLYAAFGARDRAAILRLFDPQIEWIQNEGFPGGGRYVGAETVLNEVFRRLRLEWEVWQAIVEEWLDAGDTIIALGEYRGTHRLTGKSMKAAFAHVYRIRQGHIVKFQQYTDTRKIAEATQPQPNRA